MEPPFHRELPPQAPPSEREQKHFHDTELPAPVPQTGRHFHHYEICLREDGQSLFELGRGATGITYKARDVNLDTFVALKVIHAEAPGQSVARERFRREARAAAQLRHPNVASVFHFGETPAGEPFYAMEFVEGETLASRVRRLGPLPAGLALEIVSQVTAALVAADEQGLVHRDLKPANIMLSAGRAGPSGSSVPFSGPPVVVKVIDFGLAKAAGKGGADVIGENADPLTQAGGFLGTPAYASPEQAKGGEIDARSDIYSLGVTLWFLLAAQVPFPGRSPEEICDRQINRPLPLAQLGRLQTNPSLTALLVSMLAADPAARPASPGALLEALERCRQEIAGPAPSRADLPPFARRTKNSFAVAGFITLALLALAGGGTVAYRHFRQPALVPVEKEPPVVAAPEKSIAVLPLDDLSVDKANDYFADGIQDDLLNSLTKIKDLKVISRSSVMGYRDAASRDLQKIGRQLGVATVLEGSVRRVADRVIVSAALVDVRDGHEIWTERYDRTLADSLSLQGELATEIATALRASLSPAEKANVEDKPTNNADAYVLYLRARGYQTRPYVLMQDYLTAERLYRQALALDPGFALAHAQLSATLAYIYKNFRPTEEVHAQARAEAEEAIRLRPNAGEGYLARALCLYLTDSNYPEALRELETVSRLLPGNTDVDGYVGAIRRRQGRWREGLASIQRGAARDPLSAHNAWEVMRTYIRLRDWPEAARAGDHTVALAPDDALLNIERRCIDFWSRGDLAPLRAALAAVPAGFDPDGELTFLRWDTALIARDFDTAERVVENSALDAAVVHFGISLPKSYFLGCVALARGDAARARTLLEAALPSVETDARNLPMDAFRQVRLGLLYAYLGRKDDAIRQGRQAVESQPVSKDAYSGAYLSGVLAMIYARTGENEQAVKLLERLLRTPGSVLQNFDGSITQNDLRLRWQWDPLRSDPRFRALLAGPEPKTEYR